MNNPSFENRKRPSIIDVNEQDEPSRKSRNRNFDNEETQLLIQLWGDPKMQLTLLTTHKKQQIYVKIAERMKMHGYNRSTEEVCYKLKNIKCLYNRIKKDIESNNPQTFQWLHYDAMDKILSRSVFKLPNPVPNPPNLYIHHADDGSHNSQVLVMPKEELLMCNIKDEPNDINDNEILDCQKNDEPVGSLLVCQNKKKTSVSIDNGISDYQIKEEPLDIIDNGIEEDFENVLQVFETPQNKHKCILNKDIITTESKLIGRKIQINIPKQPTSIQSDVNSNEEVRDSIPSTSYANEKVTINATVPSNIVKTVRIPIIPYLSNNACSSKSFNNSTVTASTSSQRSNIIPIQSLSSDNIDAGTNNSNLNARLSRSLKQQHQLSQHNISILQLNHAKQSPIGSTLIKNVIPLLEAEAQAEFENSSSTTKNLSQLVPVSSSPSFNKNLTTIVEIEKKRLKIECNRLAIEEERLKIESERFEFKKQNYNEVLSLLKTFVAMKKPTEDAS